MDSSKPSVIWVLGGPGSGKGTQCDLLLAKYPNNFYHISTGALLREATKVPTPQHAEIIQCMKQGKMVPSKPLVQLIQQKFKQIGNKVTFILDGFPRNNQNLQAWKQVIHNDADVKFLLYFECTVEQIRKRLLKRAQTSGRADDNPETIQKRIANFNSQTIPMLQTYKKHGGFLVSVNSNHTIQQVSQDVESLLKNRKIL